MIIHQWAGKPNHKTRPVLGDGEYRNLDSACACNGDFDACFENDPSIAL
jgi:hypothetical protein